MAERCSHHQFHIEDSLRNCREQAALMTAKHSNYMQFVDDMKSDLDDLSCQVSLVQEQLSLEEGGSSSGGRGDGCRVQSCSKATTVDAEVGSRGDGRAAETAGVAEEAKRAEWCYQLQQIEAQARLKLICEMEWQIEDQVKAKSCSALEKNSGAFRCQIDQLQHTICEKEKHINHLNCMLARLSHMRTDPQSSEDRFERKKQQAEQEEELQQLRSCIEKLQCTNESLMRDVECSHHQESFLLSEMKRLHHELKETKLKNSDVNTDTCRLSTLLQTQEHHRMELSQKYCQMEENYEEQSRKLRSAVCELSQLQDRYLKMENRTGEHNMERILLREEVMALKEKEATMLGRQKSIQEQMIKMDKELFSAHDVIKEQQGILQRNDTSHAEIIQRMLEAGNDTKRQFNQLVEDYNNLQEEYEKQSEIQKQNEKVIESFRKWKDAQLRSDEATRASFKQYEEHIKLLLEEKQRFLERYRELKRDYCTMQSEVERMRCGANSTTAPSNLSVNSIEARIELIRRTSRRLSEKSASLKDADFSSDIPLSRSKSDLL